MVSCLALLLTILNSIILIVFCLIYFKNNYTICDLETYNMLVKFYNAHFEEYDEEGNPIKEDKAGGYGFFQEQLEEVNEDDE